MKPLKSSSKKRILLIASLLLIVAGLISGLTMTAVAGKSHETQTANSEIPDPPLTFPTPVPLPPGDISGTRSEPEIVHFAGPETRGTEVLIAGKKIKLPEDAELGGLTLSDSLMFRIIRGNSIIRIGCKTGEVSFGIIAQGEEGAFDFLKQYFPDQAEAIDSLPVRDSEETSE